MDKTTFVDFIKDSDNGEYHAWRRLLLTSEEEEKEVKEAQSSLVQCSLV